MPEHGAEYICAMKVMDHLFGIVVSTSDCHPRGPGFDSRLYPRNFSGSIGSGTGSTQPREDDWVATWMRSSKIQLRKLKLRLRDNALLTTRSPPYNTIWEQPLQSILALRSCSATDFLIITIEEGGTTVSRAVKGKRSDIITERYTPCLTWVCIPCTNVLSLLIT